MEQVNLKPSAGKWAKWLGTAAGVFLGLVLLVAAYAKMLEPGAFVQEIRREGLDFLFSAETIAVLALALEAGLGLVLLMGARHRTVLLPSAALVAFFVFLTGRNYWLVAQGLRDPSESCGCFGSLWERTPAEAFWLDLLLLLPALGLAFVGRRRDNARPPWRRMAVGLVAGLAVGAAVWNASDIVYSRVANQIANAPADEAFRQSSAYVLYQGDTVVPDSKVYDSEGSAEILIDAPGLPWLALIDPRDEKVRRVDRASLGAGEDGAIHVSGEHPEVGGFSIGPRGIDFEAGGRAWTLGR